MNRLFRVFLILSVIGFPFVHRVHQAFAENRLLTLGEALRLALAHSPDALTAKSRTRQAEEALRETRSLNMPRATIGSGMAYNNGFPLSIEGSAPSIFKLEAIQPLFSIQNKNLIRGAGESAKAARKDGDIVDNELAAKTAHAYFRLDRARKIMSMNESILDETQKRQELTDIDVAAGKTRPIDAALLNTEISAARHEVLRAREQVIIAEAELRELTGLDYAVSIQTITPAMESPIYDMDAAALFERTAAASPDIMRAEAEIRAKEFNVEAEKAERYPRIAAIAEYDMFSRSNNFEDYYNRFERNGYLVGISAQLQLFDGFRSKARIAQSREELSAEQINLRRLKSDLNMNIQNGLSAIRLARSEADVAADRLKAAKGMVEINEILLESGRISEREMVDARLDVWRKEIGKLEAEYGIFQRKIDLLRVTGSILTIF